MNYKLALALKKAGFPQLGYGDNYIKKNGKTHDEIYDEMDDKGIAIEHQYIEIEDTDCYIPTLSELIKACGDGFHSLEVGLSPLDWSAYSREKILGKKIKEFVEEGKTPEIAVAKLFLKLNKIAPSGI